MLHEQHECDTSEKIFFLISVRVKTIFHSPIFTISEVKDYKERNNFILSTTFENASFPCLWKVHHKSFIKKLYTSSCKFPCTFSHSSLHKKWSFLLSISSVYVTKSHLLKKSLMENFIFCAVVTHSNADSFSMKNHFMWKYQNSF